MSKPTGLRLVVVLALSAACALGGSDAVETKGLGNGRFWVSIEQRWLMADGSVPRLPEGSLRGVTLPPAQAGAFLFKMAYVSGVSDAALSSGQEDYYFAVHANGVSTMEIMLGLDAFYKTPENLRVPIVWAMTVVSLRARGGTFENVEELIALLRKRSAEEPATEEPTPKPKKPREK